MNKRMKLKRLYAAAGMEGRLPKQMYRGISNRLGLINQLSPQENLLKSIQLSIILVIATAIYFVIANSMVNALWYHKVLLMGSTILFFLVIRESYFESLEKGIKENLPKLIKKILHYYIHYNRNIMVALEETEKRCPNNLKIYVVKIREALIDAEYETKINELQRRMPSPWLKMLCILLLFAKRQGVPDTSRDYTESRFENDPISLNLRKMIRIINFINIEQKHNTAKLIGYQIMSFLAPFFTIPVVRLYYSKLNMMIDIGNPYGDITAQTLSALLLFSGNAVALYIHWLRKLQY